MSHTVYLNKVSNSHQDAIQVKRVRQIQHEIKTVSAIFPNPPLLIFLFLKRETSDVLICSIKCQNEYYLQPL